MVRAQGEGGARRFAKTSLAVFVVFALAYWVLLAGMGRQLMGWLYGGKYAQAAAWLPWLGLLPVLAAVVSVMSSLLRALERPRSVAAVYGLLAGFAATVGIALVWAYGLRGAVQALLLVNALSAFAFLRLAKRKG
jgi:O-antigen/teichoic acid export membrane protein